METEDEWWRRTQDGSAATNQAEASSAAKQGMTLAGARAELDGHGGGGSGTGWQGLERWRRSLVLTAAWSRSSLLWPVNGSIRYRGAAS